MYTALAIAALSMGVTSGKLAPTPVWENDYRAAMARVNEAGKPMVLIVGAGKSGMESVVNEGSFDASVTKLLASKFVCVYIDTNTTSGKALAEALQIKTGVVISDKTGQTQAFSSAVALPRAMLESTLVKYAEADPKDVKKTETVVDPKAAPAVVVVGQPANCGNTGGCCNKGYSSGCCGKSYGGGCCFFGGCCGKTTSCAAPAPCAQPVSSGCCGKSYGGGCCGWGGGCCGKSYGGGCGTTYTSGGCCNKGYSYGGGWCCGK